MTVSEGRSVCSPCQSERCSAVKSVILSINRLETFSTREVCCPDAGLSIGSAIFGFACGIRGRTPAVGQGVEGGRQEGRSGRGGGHRQTHRGGLGGQSTGATPGPAAQKAGEGRCSPARRAAGPA